MNALQALAQTHRNLLQGHYSEEEISKLLLQRFEKSLAEMKRFPRKTEPYKSRHEAAVADLEAIVADLKIGA